MDFSKRFETLHGRVRARENLHKCVCLLDCHVGSRITPFFPTCVANTSKPLDSKPNPAAENFEAESAAIDRLLSRRARPSTLDLCYTAEPCSPPTHTHMRVRAFVFGAVAACTTQDISRTGCRQEGLALLGPHCLCPSCCQRL